MNEMVNEKESGMEIDLAKLMQAYLKKWKVIAVCALLGIAIAFGITNFAITPMYQTKATILVNNRAMEGSSGVTSSDLSASIYLVKNYMILTESEVVLQAVSERLNDQYTPAELRSYLKLEEREETVIYLLYITHPDPEEAARITNAFADVISVVGPNKIKGTSASAIDTAVAPSSPHSPSMSTNLILGAAAGLLIAVAYATIAFLRDNRIKEENDLTSLFNLPILGRIPDLNGKFADNGYYGLNSKD